MCVFPWKEIPEISRIYLRILILNYCFVNFSFLYLPNFPHWECTNSATRNSTSNNFIWEYDKSLTRKNKIIFASRWHCHFHRKVKNSGLMGILFPYDLCLRSIFALLSRPALEHLGVCRRKTVEEERREALHTPTPQSVSLFFAGFAYFWILLRL